MKNYTFLIILLFSNSAIALDCNWGKIDNTMVQAYIDDSLKRYKKSGNVAKIQKSYLFLRDIRRGPQPCDYDLSAAEHYMYARFVTAASGDSEFPSEIKKYDVAKRILNYFGQLNLLQTTPLPVSPPSDELLEWGLKGAKAGIKDYKSLNPGKPLKPGAAKNVSESFAKKLYESKLSY